MNDIITTEKDFAYTITVEPYIIPKCRCGFKLGEYVEDGYVEVFENMYEEIKPNNPYNNINRCPYCGQLLDWKYKSRLGEDDI